MQPLRTFVAVEISPEVRSSALRLIERLKVAPAKVTWTKAANLHYTLKFLGDVAAERTNDICRAVQEAVGPFSPFEIVAQGVGAFPAVSHPRTLWLGVSDGAEQMELLFQAVERLLEPLGFAEGASAVYGARDAGAGAGEWQGGVGRFIGAAEEACGV